MNKYLKEKANYNKFPIIQTGLKSAGVSGWNAITHLLEETIATLQNNKIIIVIECYHGVHDTEILSALQQKFEVNYFISTDYFLSEKEIDALVHPDVTDDEIFGYISRLNITDFFDKNKLQSAKEVLKNHAGISFVYGCGASVICPAPDVLIYADMARWEIQLRFRKNEISNLGSSNKMLKTSLQYKRAFYVDWRVCDRVKKKILPTANYILDTNKPQHPKMVTGIAYMNALQITVQQPFRVVPFFDPGPWGGQWMKEYCGLDGSAPNYAWCFDCVPEENSLLLQFGDIVFETPGINLVYFKASQLLGDAVEARFGDEFPIRFDFLDTMDGGNLSLQVHPTTTYAQEKFGIHYTQDESYYLLDAAEDAVVYAGFKDDADANEMFAALEASQNENVFFDAEKYVQKWPVKKHDHLLIPAGTIHCSGKNSMVLEISATPFNFTFKLWDWGRMGLDGKPRPINMKHGAAVINKTIRTETVKRELLNTTTVVEKGYGWWEEKTGLHEREFIETRRHWFTKKVTHVTNGGVNVLNLIEGREAIIESPSNAFEPFMVHYAETFIIPANIKTYTIRPFGESEGKQCATIKAFVRTNP